MSKPDGCDDFFYKLMKWCWKYEPSKRLNFQEIIKFLLVKLTETDNEFLAQFKRNSFYFNQNVVVDCTDV
jgi:Protein tyrosine and serine/threonine kinase